MWPAEQQPGGQPYPQGTPPQQPPVPQEQPNPYAKVGQQPAGPQQPAYPPPVPPAPPQAAPQGPAAAPPGPPAPPSAYPQSTPYAPPSPYAQPGYQPHAAGYPAPQGWGAPIPGGPQQPQPGGRKGLTTGVAIAAAVAVIAAVAAGAVYLTGSGDKKDEAGGSPNPSTPAVSQSATPSPTSTEPAVTAGSGDSPRGGPDSQDVKPVVPGWKVVKRGERNVAFDVPPDWTLDSEGTTIGFEDDKGQPAVAMGAPAYYKHDWCTTPSGGGADRAAAGTKGANGATSLRNAAEVQAEAWAYWAYQDHGKGTFSKALNSRTFHNSHGIDGWQAQATATGIPRSNKCSSDGAAYTVAWVDPAATDPTRRLVVWVLYCDRGVADELPASTIEKIKSSIRPLKTG